MNVHHVFGKRQTILNYHIDELLGMMADNRLQLRKINKPQVRMIRTYIFDNMPAKQVYLPPLVAYIEEGSLDEGKPDKLTIIDGTQRLQAFAELDAHTQRAIVSEEPQEQKKGYTWLYEVENIEIAVQIFEGLSKAEADQLFIDLNTKGKKVALSKRIAYDSRSSINQITNRLLQQHTELRKAGVDEEKVAIVRPRNKKFLSLTQLRRIIGYFMSGQTISSSLSVDVTSPLSAEENIELISVWLDELFKLHPAESIGDYEVSMLAGFPLVVALVQYTMDGLRNKSFEEKKKEVIRRMRNLQRVDWTRDQEVWEQFTGQYRGKENYYYLANDKRNINALAAWLVRKGGE